MNQLWFRQDDQILMRRGDMIFDAREDGVWAFVAQPLIWPEDPGAEAAHLLGTYGAAVHGLGHLLSRAGVVLPEELATAGAARRPAAEMGGWEPALLTIDGVAQLALHRAHGVCRITCTTRQGRHLTCLTPSSVRGVQLFSGNYLTRDLDGP